MIDLSKLEQILKDSWSKETSSDPDNWSPENPAWGQCAVTSLIVNDCLGGEIVWAPAILPNGKEISHYFNKINGKEIDLTREQFPSGTKIPLGIPKSKQFSTTREYILSYPETQRRYEILKQKVQKALELT